MRRTSTLVLALLALCATSAHAAPRFQSSFRSFATQLYALGVAVADYDHDGRPDMVVAIGEYASDELALFRGTADGFVAVDTIPVGSPRLVRSARLDADPHEDLVVSSRNVTYVLRGNGDLTFQPPQGYGTFLSVNVGLGLDLEDVTGDGVLDVVVADSLNIIRIRPGVGDGTLGPAASLSTPGYVSGIRVADLDGDGDRDIAVTANELRVFLNAGGGVFGAGTAYPITGTGLAVGDVDEDGDLDLVAGVDLFAGNGDGTFAAPAPVGELDYEFDPLLADLDDDGLLDLVTGVVTDGFFPGPINLNFRGGNGDGSFDAPIARTSGIGPQSAIAADADGDGRMDVVVGGSAFAQVCVHRGLGPLGLEQNPPHPVPGVPVDVAVADVTDDDIPDVVAVVSQPPTLRVFAGNGDLTLATPVDLAPPPEIRRVGIGDFNDDGIPDLVTANGGSATISQYLGTGAGGFAARTDHSAATAVVDLVVADVGGDGYDDAIAIGSTATRVFPGQPGGGFAARLDHALPNGTRIATGRLNGDAYADFAVVWGTFVHYYLGQAGGGLSSATTIGLGHSFESAQALAIADIDGDTDSDVVVGSVTGPIWRQILNNGSGSLSAGPIIPGSRRTYSFEVGDVNGDGIPDWVSGGWFFTNAADVFFGTGTGTPARDAGYGASGAVVDVALGDLDGDGYPELVTADDHSQGGTVLAGAITVMPNSQSFVLDVPSAHAPVASLTISRVWPTVARDELHVEFALPIRGETTLELFDVGGRRLLRSNLGTLEAGTQTRTLAVSTSVPVGIVWVRLRQGGAGAVARAVVAR